MRRVIMIAAAVLALGLSACGGDDGGGDTSSEEEHAQEVTADAIAAMREHDFETFCSLSTQEVNDSISKLGKADTCAAGYETLFKRQSGFGEGEHPFDDFVSSLADYEVGEATATDTGAQVLLDGPEVAATLLVDEDGELKVSELFVTPDANTPGGADAAPGSVQPSG